MQEACTATGARLPPPFVEPSHAVWRRRSLMLMHAGALQHSVPDTATHLENTGMSLLTTSLLGTAAFVLLSGSDAPAQIARTRAPGGETVPAPAGIPRNPQFFMPVCGAARARCPLALSTLGSASRWLTTSTKASRFIRAAARRRSTISSRRRQA